MAFAAACDVIFFDSRGVARSRAATNPRRFVASPSTESTPRACMLASACRTLERPCAPRRPSAHMTRARTTSDRNPSSASSFNRTAPEGRGSIRANVGVELKGVSWR
eukprot:31108-Pelagococcus_subviridis.AAC.3